MHMLARSRAMRRRAFTLVEMLVVIGIIVLLVTIGVVVIGKVQRTAEIARIKQEFQTIAAALDVYRNDFPEAHGYPAVPRTSPETMKGSYVLARWLVGAGDFDGQPGPGYRIGPPDASGIPTGPVHAPILQPHQFRISPVPYDPSYDPGSIASRNKYRDYHGQFELYDYAGNPIQYFPRQKSKCKNGLPPSQLVGNNGLQGGCFAFDVRPGIDNLPQATLAAVLGDDSNYNNIIDGTETLRFSGEYILASPGLDNQWTQIQWNMAPSAGRKAMAESDDVYNFDR